MLKKQNLNVINSNTLIQQQEQEQEQTSMSYDGGLNLIYDSSNENKKKPIENGYLKNLKHFKQKSAKDEYPPQQAKQQRQQHYQQLSYDLKFTNHQQKLKQFDAKAMQEQMLLEYLNIARDDIEAKKEIHDTKQQRLEIAQCELKYYLNKLDDNHSINNLNVNHVNNNNNNNWKQSVMSLNSNYSTNSITEYEPDVIKKEVSLAKKRIDKLKSELKEIEVEINQKELNVNTLDELNRKVTNEAYSLDEALLIVNELKTIRNTIICGEQERKALIDSLLQIKDEFIKTKLKDSDDLLAGSHYESTNGLNIGSQIEVNGENHVNTVAELARMRLEYDELRKKLKHFQSSISNINNYVSITQTESDKDRLLLIKEKEQLLSELKSLNLKTKTPEQINIINKDIKEIELFLLNANAISSNDITKRLKMNQERNMLIEQLKATTQRMALLEAHLKSVSISTLSSLSSGSSRGSLASLYSYGGSTNSLYRTNGFNTPSSFYYAPIYSPNILSPVKNRSSMDLLKTTIEENFNHISNNSDDGLPKNMAHMSINNTKIESQNLTPLKNDNLYFAKPVNGSLPSSKENKLEEQCEKLLNLNVLKQQIEILLNFEILFKTDLNQLEIIFQKINNFNDLKNPPDHHYQIEVFATNSLTDTDFFITKHPILIINEFNNSTAKTISIQLNKYKSLNYDIKILRIFLILTPNIINTTNQSQDKHILAYNEFSLNDNFEEIVTSSPKKHLFNFKLDQIWLKNEEENKTTHKNINLNLCSICNKKLINKMINFYNKKNKLKTKLTTENSSGNSSMASSNKLLRSDSDSSMHLCKKTLFDRMSKERRSLRYKKNSNHRKTIKTNLARQISKLNTCDRITVKEKHILAFNKKTPLELELELKLSQVELNKLNNELSNLKDIKQTIEINKEIIDENKNKQNKYNTIFVNDVENKADILFKKSNKKIIKLAQRSNQSYSFKEKLDYFTNLKPSNSIVQDVNGYSDDEHVEII